MEERIFKVLLNLLKMSKIPIQDIGNDPKKGKESIFIDDQYKSQVISIITKMGYTSNGGTSSRNLEEVRYDKGDYYIEVDHFKLRNYLFIEVHKYGE